MTDSSGLQSNFEQHSLHRLLPYEGYDPERHLFINRHSVGWGIRFAPMTGCDEASLTILSSVLTDVLPLGSDVQVLLWGSPHLGPRLNQLRQAIQGHHATAQQLIEKQLDYLSQGAYRRLLPHQTNRLRHQHGFIFFSVPKKHAEASAHQLVALREAMLSSLKSIQVAACCLTVDDFLTTWHALLHPNRSLEAVPLRWNIHRALSEQLVHCERSVRVTPNQLLFEQDGQSTAVRTLSVQRFPETVHQAQMSEAMGQLFNSTLQIPCPYVLSLTFRILPKAQTQRRIQSKLLGRSKAMQPQLLQWLPQLKQELDDWTEVQRRVQTGERLVHAQFQVVLLEGIKTIDTAERQVKDLFTANGWTLQNPRYLALPSWLATLPMLMTEGVYQDLNRFGRLHTMTSFNAVNIAPLQGEWQGTDSPLLVLPGRRGQLSHWNPFANDQGNYNTAIAAGSGKGKSVLVQYYLTSLLATGGRAWVIDIGHSYEKTCTLLQGEFIAFNLEQPICLNFFTQIENDTVFKAQLPLLVPLVATLARQKSETTEEEDRFIEQALRNAWELKHSEATVTTLKTCLEQCNHPTATNLAHLLSSYATGGMYADFFEGACTLNFDNPCIVLELLGLKDKKTLQRVVLFALLTRIHQAMYLGRRTQPKSCIIDEAWDLLSDEAGHAAQFIETGYRTARRHFGNFVSITQSLQDYYQNKTAQAAFTNADFTLILGQKAQDIEALQQSERFPMNEHIKRCLKSLRTVDKAYAECLIQSPQGLTVHRILLAPYLRVLFSSKGPEYDAVKQLQAQGLSLDEAVTRVVQSTQSDRQ